MEKEKLRQLQLVQLSIMEDIHRVCYNNNLKYYLVYGSALGAIRHKGLIPWDVDIDIAMPRKDYEAFVDDISMQLKPEFVCVSYKSVEKYLPPHALVLMKNTKIIDLTGQRQSIYRPSEIFVDIFPLDVCPESKLAKKIQDVSLRIIKRIKYRKASFIYKGNGVLKIAVKRTIKGGLSLFSWRFLNRLQDKIMTNYNLTSHSGLLCSMVGAYGYEKNSVPKEWYGTPTLTEFEHTKLYVPEKVHEILVQTYGDYMCLPSEEKQKEQMESFVDAQW